MDIHSKHTTRRQTVKRRPIGKHEQINSNSQDPYQLERTLYIASIPIITSRSYTYFRVRVVPAYFLSRKCPMGLTVYGEIIPIS